MIFKSESARDYMPNLERSSLSVLPRGVTVIHVGAPRTPYRVQIFIKSFRLRVQQSEIELGYKMQTSGVSLPGHKCVLIKAFKANISATSQALVTL